MNGQGTPIRFVRLLSRKSEARDEAPCVLRSKFSASATLARMSFRFCAGGATAYGKTQGRTDASKATEVD
jgi:hypothetical protein